MKQTLKQQKCCTHFSYSFFSPCLFYLIIKEHHRVLLCAAGSCSDHKGAAKQHERCWKRFSFSHRVVSDGSMQELFASKPSAHRKVRESHHFKQFRSLIFCKLLWGGGAEWKLTRPSFNRGHMVHNLPTIKWFFCVCWAFFHLWCSVILFYTNKEFSFVISSTVSTYHIYAVTVTWFSFFYLIRKWAHQWYSLWKVHHVSISQPACLQFPVWQCFMKISQWSGNRDAFHGWTKTQQEKKTAFKDKKIKKYLCFSSMYTTTWMRQSQPELFENILSFLNKPQGSCQVFTAPSTQTGIDSLSLTS